MHPLLESSLHFLGGLVLLVIGGRLLVSASVDTARRLGVSPLVVGLTLVAWGTSAPELALNLASSISGRGNLALGNVVGANICNMSLVLGVCALIRPLAVQERLIKIEIWLNAAILGFMAALGVFTGFARWEIGLMLGVFGAYSTWTIMSSLRAAERSPKRASAPEMGREPSVGPRPMGWWMIGTCFVGGLALLGLGGKLASDGAVGVATWWGVPTAIVGATIVAIGTTLPEIITGILAVRKGQTDLAMGNAIGSCLFNAGAIFGVAGLIAPPTVEGPMTLPLAYMALLAIALLYVSRSDDRTVSRIEGGALLGSYVVFLGIMAWQAMRGGGA